jgi:hypothetical protein
MGTEALDDGEEWETARKFAQFESLVSLDLFAVTQDPLMLPLVTGADRI